MPCTKLDPDISGVCKIAGTRPMISYPVKAASMKMYNATKPVMVVVRSIGIPLIDVCSARPELVEGFLIAGRALRQAQGEQGKKYLAFHDLLRRFVFDFTGMSE